MPTDCPRSRWLRLRERPARHRKPARRLRRGRSAQGLSVSVNAGEAVALIGANGAGKSTLFKSIVGFLRPAGGQLHFLGRDMTGACALPPQRACGSGSAIHPKAAACSQDLRFARIWKSPCSAAGPNGRSGSTQAFASVSGSLPHGRPSAGLATFRRAAADACDRAGADGPAATAAARRTLARAFPEARRRSAGGGRGHRQATAPSVLLAEQNVRKVAVMLRPRLRARNRKGGAFAAPPRRCAIPKKSGRRSSAVDIDMPCAGETACTKQNSCGEYWNSRSRE